MYLKYIVFLLLSKKKKTKTNHPTEILNKDLNRHFTIEDIWVQIFTRKYAQYN